MKNEKMKIITKINLTFRHMFLLSRKPISMLQTFYPHRQQSEISDIDSEVYQYLQHLLPFIVYITLCHYVNFFARRFKTLLNKFPWKQQFLLMIVIGKHFP